LKKRFKGGEGSYDRKNARRELSVIACATEKDAD
jgi:hypothetical protein